MRPIFRRLWRRKPLLIIGFSLAIALTVLFGVRTAFKYSYWSQHEHERVAPWMTPHFVARTNNVDVEFVRQSLGLPAGDNDRRTIYRIARDTDQSPRDLVKQVEDALAKVRAEGGADPQ